MANELKIVGVGSPIVDMVASVDDCFIDGIRGDKGGMVMVDAAEMRAMLERLPAPAVRTTGGSAGNTIAALARLGAQATLLGTVGADEAGDFYRRELERCGGSAEGLRTVASAAPTAVCLCLVTPDAERTMRPNLAAALEFNPESVTPADFADRDWVYIEGYMLVQPERGLARMCEVARAAGCRIALDLASFEMVRNFREPIARILRGYVDMLFANADEAEALVGAGQPEAQLARLREYADTAVLKVGAGGAWASEGTAVAFAPGRKVPALDTTAAGDSFAAGFMHGRHRNWTLEQALAFGNLVASEVVQVYGAVIPERGWANIRLAAAELDVR